jgi:predicted metal-binding transcription factor (methanogenesis marker protein 9)
VVCGIDNQTFNPFSNHIDWKQQLKSEITNSSKIQNKPRHKYMDHFIDEKEEARRILENRRLEAQLPLKRPCLK